MKISTKTQYGLRFLMHLSASNEKQYVKLNEVSHKHQIPEKYLENIVSQIKASGLIEVKRGARGGYKLARPAKEIIIREVFEALDGEILVFETDNAGAAETPNFFVLQEFLKDFKSNVDRYLNSVSLDDLAQKIKMQNENQMYYI